MPPTALAHRAVLQRRGQVSSQACKAAPAAGGGLAAAAAEAPTGGTGTELIELANAGVGGAMVRGVAPTPAPKPGSESAPCISFLMLLLAPEHYQHSLKNIALGGS